MFKSYFIHGLLTSVLSTVFGAAYMQFYYKEIADFSEAASLTALISGNILFGMTACFVAFALQMVIQKRERSEFVFNLLCAAFVIALILYILKMDDPTFKNEDASILSCYYKGFLLPLIFFPILSWFALQPILIKK
jgi:hypothetical protein